MIEEKGIPYYNDFACSKWREKHHVSGYRNIYTVKMTYVSKADYTTTKSIEMPYGKCSLAMDRMLMEIKEKAHSSPENWHVSEIEIVSTTYDGTKPVLRDIIEVMRF